MSITLIIANRKNNERTKLMLRYVEYLERVVGQSVPLHILDLVIVDQVTHHPLKWIYTDVGGRLQVKSLLGQDMPSIINEVIASIAGTASRETRSQGKMLVGLLDHRD